MPKFPCAGERGNGTFGKRPNKEFWISVKCTFSATMEKVQSSKQKGQILRTPFLF